MGVSNDKFCTWINELNPRTNIQTLSKDLESEWLIVGAGYTGLSAARKLAEIYPNKIPNLNQILFKGVKILDFTSPKIKNINEIIKDHILKSSLLAKGKTAISKNTTKKTIPKLRFELILKSSI